MGVISCLGGGLHSMSGLAGNVIMCCGSVVVPKLKLYVTLPYYSHRLA